MQGSTNLLSAFQYGLVTLGSNFLITDESTASVAVLFNL